MTVTKATIVCRIRPRASRGGSRQSVSDNIQISENGRISEAVAQAKRCAG
jgi:hypothetical protein